MQDWPHAPVHRLSGEGTFFITGATYLKQPYFAPPSALDDVQNTLFAKASQHDCTLQSWALFANHYHLIIQCPDAKRLATMLATFHSSTAIDANRRDGVPGRRVWFQYRDTALTFERSWLARVKYTTENAVHHQLVRCAVDYKWCSAGWLERVASRSFLNTLRRIKVDRVNVDDDF